MGVVLQLTRSMCVPLGNPHAKRGSFVLAHWLPTKLLPLSIAQTAFCVVFRALLSDILNNVLAHIAMPSTLHQPDKNPHKGSAKARILLPLVDTSENEETKKDPETPATQNKNSQAGDEGHKGSVRAVS